MGYGFIAIVVFFFGIATAMAADGRGRNGSAWFFLGLFFGPFGLLFALLTSKNVRALEEKALRYEDMKRCPHCAELVKSHAAKCRYCASELEVIEAPSPAVKGAGPD